MKRLRTTELCNHYIGVGSLHLTHILLGITVVVKHFTVLILTCVKGSVEGPADHGRWRVHSQCFLDAPAGHW